MIYFMSQKKTSKYFKFVVSTTERELLSGQDHVAAADTCMIAGKKFLVFFL